MGVLQRFERRLEDVVEGAFARVFGGAVQPTEVATALQREAEQRKVLVAAGRTLVPNDYVVELGDSDAERLAAYDLPLRRELAAMVGEHAAEQGWSFVGPVAVRFVRVPDLRTGVFRVRSAVIVGVLLGAPGTEAPLPSAADSPVLVLGDRPIPLGAAVTVIGRGVEADLRLLDAEVSRLHAELRRGPDGSVVLVDAGSTNGTLVNDLPVDQVRLSDGDRIRVGGTTLTFRVDATTGGATAGDAPSPDAPSPDAP